MSEPTKPEAVRPVWGDRIYGGDGRPLFDITNPHLPQIAPVVQEGTLHTAGRMNNLFVFDNWIAMSDTEYSIKGLTPNTTKIERRITEKEPDEETGEKRIIAAQIIELNGGVWTTTEELYNINEFGQNVVVQKRISSEQRISPGEWKGGVL